MNRYYVKVEVSVDADSEDDAIDKVQNGEGSAIVTDVYQDRSWN